MAKETLAKLLTEIRACRVCEEFLPCGPRPVVIANKAARILIVGQAPGLRVHKSGIPWDDPSGVRLRNWLGIDSAVFYDARKFAIVPMGFCYPGKGPSGDLPPRKECAELWHDRLLDKLPNIKLTLVLGQYAQTYLLGTQKKSNLTKTVAAWKQFTPDMLPMPHPSPRNNRWLGRNPWFAKQVLPWLKKQVGDLLA